MRKYSKMKPKSSFTRHYMHSSIIAQFHERLYGHVRNSHILRKKALDASKLCENIDGVRENDDESDNDLEHFKGEHTQIHSY